MKLKKKVEIQNPKVKKINSRYLVSGTCQGYKVSTFVSADVAKKLKESKKKK